MTDLTKEVEVNEALFNIGKLIGRLPSDESKRLSMLMATVMKHMKQLEKENAQLRDGDDFDMDGRC
jgi:predicted ribonuclease YlaK